MTIKDLSQKTGIPASIDKDRWRRKRICLDLDAKNQLQLLKTYFNAKAMFPNSPIELKETEQGFHIRIFKNHSVHENFQTRMTLGDDPMRISIDEKRLAWGLIDWIDTMFTFKKVNGKISKEEDYNIFSLPFFFRFPCRKPKAFKRLN